MRSDATEQSEHALHEERRFRETTVNEMGQVVQVRDVVTLVLETRTVRAA